MEDYLGYKIKIGDRAIRVHSSGHYKQFKRCTVRELDEEKLNDKYDGCGVGILTDGNSRIGWVYPSRIITEKAFKGDI